MGLTMDSMMPIKNQRSCLRTNPDLNKDSQQMQMDLECLLKLYIRLGILHPGLFRLLIYHPYLLGGRHVMNTDETDEWLYLIIEYTPG